MAEQTQEKGNEFKFFDKYDASGITVKDAALRPFINFSPRLLLKSHGRNLERFGKTKVNILERLAGKLQVPGHMGKGKRHKVITSWSSGKYNRNMTTVLKTMEIIEKKTNKNPVQVLIDAIENGSPRDEITVIEHAGARYPQSVDSSPMRRVDIALRWLVHGSYMKAFGKKTKMAEALANEIINASQGNMESYSLGKKNEAEKQADSAR